MPNLDIMLKNIFPNIQEETLITHKQLAVQKLILYFKNSLNRTISEQELETEYQYALFLLVSNAINYADIKGIKSIEQGNKKTTFVESISTSGAYEITDEIKSLLPVPLIKLRG